MALFEFINPSASSYFIMETVRNNQGFYNGSALKAASGSLNIVSNIPSTGVVQSDYIWGTVVPPGSSSLAFTASLDIPTGSVYFRGTGEFTVTITPDSTPSFDADAQLFITNAAITDSTQQTAVNNLVVALKGYNIWTKMKALYPFVGGTAAQHKYNLRNPLDTDAAFRLIFNGGWTHSSTGALPNGTNGYANTFFLPGTGFSSSTSRHLSFYLRTNNVGGGDPVDMGVINFGSPTHDPSVPAGNDYLFNGNSNLFKGQSTSIDVSTPTTDRRGLSLISKTSINQSLFKNGVIKATSSGTGAYTELFPIWIGGVNISNNFFPYGPTNNEFSIASIGDGLTDTEAANYYTAVQTFQTTLSRNV